MPPQKPTHNRQVLRVGLTSATKFQFPAFDGLQFTLAICISWPPSYRVTNLPSCRVAKLPLLNFNFSALYKSSWQGVAYLIFVPPLLHNNQRTDINMCTTTPIPSQYQPKDTQQFVILQLISEFLINEHSAESRPISLQQHEYAFCDQ